MDIWLQALQIRWKRKKVLNATFYLEKENQVICMREKKNTNKLSLHILLVFLLDAR